MPESSELMSALDAVHGRIEVLARRQATGMALPELVAAAVEEAAAMLRIMLSAEHKSYTSDADLLALWKALVKGSPHWNTIRDNCRELIYYQNCLRAERGDALPTRPDRMVMHTLRHIHLYLRSYVEQHGGGQV